MKIDQEQHGRLMHESWSHTQREWGCHGPEGLDTPHPPQRIICSLRAPCDNFDPDLIPWDALPEKQKDIYRNACDFEAVRRARKPRKRLEGRRKRETTKVKKEGLLP